MNQHPIRPLIGSVFRRCEGTKRGGAEMPTRVNSNGDGVQFHRRTDVDHTDTVIQLEFAADECRRQANLWMFYAREAARKARAYERQAASARAMA